jgi:hypothetical protein
MICVGVSAGSAEPAAPACQQEARQLSRLSQGDLKSWLSKGKDEYSNATF